MRRAKFSEVHASAASRVQYDSERRSTSDARFRGRCIRLVPSQEVGLVFVDAVLRVAHRTRFLRPSHRGRDVSGDDFLALVDDLKSKVGLTSRAQLVWPR